MAKPFNKNSFYSNIAKSAESDHGSTATLSNDEADIKANRTTFDIGYGHKIKDSEWISGKIHGVPFYDSNTGEFIPLTTKEKEAIYQTDMQQNLSVAFRTTSKVGKNKAWLNAWDKIEEPYKAVLTSLAFNVGGTTAGSDYYAVLEAAKNKDVTTFAKELRRKDAGEHTKGMDNRVVKELYYAGLIDYIDDVKAVLDKADTNEIPSKPKPKPKTTATNANTYTIKAGDNLWKVSKANNITVDKLKQINNLKDDKIKVGQVLQLPTRSK